MFALTTGISLKDGNSKSNQTSIYFEIDLSKELGWKRQLSINGLNNAVSFY